MHTITIDNEVLTVSDLYELTDSQRQTMTEDYLSRRIRYCMNSEIEALLALEHTEHSDLAPFDSSDMVNNEPYCELELNGKWVQLCQDDIDGKLDYYECLRDKAQDAYDSYESKLSDAADDEYDAMYERLESFETNTLNRFNDACDALNNAECDIYPEVMQWFLCPDLCYHLKQEGEVVLNDEYWGRCAYGQAISLDNVIQQIAFNVMARHSVEG